MAVLGLTHSKTPIYLPSAKTKHTLTEPVGQGPAFALCVCTAPSTTVEQLGLLDTIIIHTNNLNACLGVLEGILQPQHTIIYDNLT